MFNWKNSCYKSICTSGEKKIGGNWFNWFFLLPGGEWCRVVGEKNMWRTTKGLWGEATCQWTDI